MEAVVMVSDVTTKEGVGKNDKPWKLWNLVDANNDRYTTFDASLGNRLDELKGKRATVTFDQTEKGRDLKDAHEAAADAKLTGGSRWDDPVTQRRVTVLACLKVADGIVNHAADEEEGHVPAAERTNRVKVVAVALADWVETYATGEVPF